MKLTFSPASPLAPQGSHCRDRNRAERQDRSSVAISGGAWPGPTEEYSRINAAEKKKELPVLILDNGDVILDSYVITEYLDELAGGGKLDPGLRPRRAGR